MSWFWLAAAAVLLAAVLLTVTSLRRLAVEARALQVSLQRWDRLAVSVDDLQHESRRVERNLRRLARR